MKLGKREIDALACPSGKRDLIKFDGDLPGFGIRVTAAGAKTFLLQYQLGGRQGRRVRMTLGHYGELTAAQARRLAEAARGRVLAGRDPAAERSASIAAANTAAKEQRRRAAADVFTLGALVDRWVGLGLADRSASHQLEAPRAVRVCFADLLGLPAHGMDPAAVQRAIDVLAERRPVMARRARDYGRAMFNWAIRRRLVSANPFAGVVIEGREISRGRVLSDAELGEAWRAAGVLPYPFGPFLRVTMLTLQRRGEVAGMRWSELAEDLFTWTIPAERAKNRRAHIVHLAEPVRAILRELPRGADGGLIFRVCSPGRAGTAPPTQPLSAFSGAKERVMQAIDAERAKAPAARETASPLPALDWRLHDFRRTGVTTLARLGFAPHVADRLLNHVQGTIRGVAAVYQRHEFLAERETALLAWADHVLAVGDGQPMAGNVVELRRA
jgi:integrase